MHKKGLSFWDILAWVFLILLVIWLVLKISGIIGTPTLIEYFPYFGLAYWAGWAIHKLTNVSADVHQLKFFAKDTVKEINNLKNEFNKINLRCEYNHRIKK